MNQFTSHINFSLTKKRLEMMRKRSTIRIKLAKLSLLLPVICSMMLLFCETSVNESGRLFVNGIELREEPTLFYQHIDGSTTNRPNRDSFNGLRAFTRDGEPFTGVQKTLNVTENRLQSETIFEHGWAKSSSLIEPMPNSDIIRMDFEYEPERRIVQKAFNEQNELIKKGDAIYTAEGILKTVEKNDYDAKNTLTKRSITTFKNNAFNGFLELSEGRDTVHHSYFDGKLRIIKTYHSNGQLKFKSAKSDFGYEGLMTMYDENGNITRQELYENGELIEKIK